MSEKPEVTIHHEHMAAIAQLPPAKARALAGALLVLATQDECPQWVRNAAESIYLDSIKGRRQGRV